MSKDDKKSADGLGGGLGGDMKDIVWRRNEPDSPCQTICLMDPDSGLCIGCYRTGEEIARWTEMGATARQKITAELPTRAGRVKRGRKGGRRAKRV